ncbi:MAG: energy-coupling factor transporter transmembrane component T [Gemmatimonadales bacterium]
MSGLAHRAHPFTPATVALALAVMALVAPPPQGTLLVYVVTVGIALLTGGIRGVILGVVVCLPFWILLVIMHGVMGDAPRAIAVLGVALSTAGMAWALEQGLRLAAIVTASLVFATSFDPHRFLQAAIARGWRFDMAFLVVATLDAADRLREQAVRLREAQRTRGLRIGRSLLSKSRAIPALVFPLMLMSVMEADERALALETRGLTLVGPRTSIDPPHDRSIDRMIRWAALLLVGATAWWRFG